MTRKMWSVDEIDKIKSAYATAETSEQLNLAGLSEMLGRSMASISSQAGRLGLRDIKRKGVNVRKDLPKYSTAEDLRAAQSRMAKERIASNGHPRGMLGKTHTQEMKANLSNIHSAKWAALSEDEKSAHIMKMAKGRVAKIGSFNGTKSRGSWKAGWREIGGKRNYYRSRWEANYARYLEWLKVRGEISEWKHEPETFWFDSIKRGVRSYLPDFRVWEVNGSSNLHEVKGWMDARSKTTLKRMAKYHPEEKITLIREKDYNAIARTVGRMIDGWEGSGRNDRY